AAMADVVVNGPPQIEPITAPARQIAPRQPRAHDPGKLRGRFMRLRDLIRTGKLAEIHLGEILGARSALHPSLTAARGRRVIRWRHLIGGGVISAGGGARL